MTNLNKLPHFEDTLVVLRDTLYKSAEDFESQSRFQKNSENPVFYEVISFHNRPIQFHSFVILGENENVSLESDDSKCNFVSETSLKCDPVDLKVFVRVLSDNKPPKYKRLSLVNNYQDTLVFLDKETLDLFCQREEFVDKVLLVGSFESLSYLVLSFKSENKNYPRWNFSNKNVYYGKHILDLNKHIIASDSLNESVSPEDSDPGTDNEYLKLLKETKNTTYRTLNDLNNYLVINEQYEKIQNLKKNLNYLVEDINSQKHLEEAVMLMSKFICNDLLFKDFLDYNVLESLTSQLFEKIVYDSENNQFKLLKLLLRDSGIARYYFDKLQFGKSLGRLTSESSSVDEKSCVVNLLLILLSHSFSISLFISNETRERSFTYDRFVRYASASTVLSNICNRSLTDIGINISLYIALTQTESIYTIFKNFRNNESNENKLSEEFTNKLNTLSRSINYTLERLKVLEDSVDDYQSNRNKFINQFAVSCLRDTQFPKAVGFLFDCVYYQLCHFPLLSVDVWNMVYKPFKFVVKYLEYYQFQDSLATLYRISLLVLKMKEPLENSVRNGFPYSKEPVYSYFEKLSKDCFDLLLYSRVLALISSTISQGSFDTTIDHLYSLSKDYESFYSSFTKILEKVPVSTFILKSLNSYVNLIRDDSPPALMNKINKNVSLLLNLLCKSLQKDQTYNFLQNFGKSMMEFMDFYLLKFGKNSKNLDFELAESTLDILKNLYGFVGLSSEREKKEIVEDAGEFLSSVLRTVGLDFDGSVDFRDSERVKQLEGYVKQEQKENDKETQTQNGNKELLRKERENKEKQRDRDNENGKEKERKSYLKNERKAAKLSTTYCNYLNYTLVEYKLPKQFVYKRARELGVEVERYREYEKLDLSVVPKEKLPLEVDFALSLLIGLAQVGENGHLFRALLENTESRTNTSTKTNANTNTSLNTNLNTITNTNTSLNLKSESRSNTEPETKLRLETTSKTQTETGLKPKTKSKSNPVLDLWLYSYSCVSSDFETQLHAEHNSFSSLVGYSWLENAEFYLPLMVKLMYLVYLSLRHVSHDNVNVSIAETLSSFRHSLSVPGSESSGDTDSFKLSSSEDEELNLYYFNEELLNCMVLSSSYLFSSYGRVMGSGQDYGFPDMLYKLMNYWFKRFRRSRGLLLNCLMETCSLLPRLYEGAAFLIVCCNPLFDFRTALRYRGVDEEINKREGDETPSSDKEDSENKRDEVTFTVNNYSYRLEKESREIREKQYRQERQDKVRNDCVTTLFNNYSKLDQRVLVEFMCVVAYRSYSADPSGLVVTACLSSYLNLNSLPIYEFVSMTMDFESKNHDLNTKLRLLVFYSNAVNFSSFGNCKQNKAILSVTLKCLKFANNLFKEDNLPVYSYPALFEALNNCFSCYNKLWTRDREHVSRLKNFTSYIAEAVLSVSWVFRILNSCRVDFSLGNTYRSRPFDNSPVSVLDVTPPSQQEMMVERLGEKLKEVTQEGSQENQLAETTEKATREKQSEGTSERRLEERLDRSNEYVPSDVVVMGLSAVCTAFQYQLLSLSTLYSLPEREEFLKKIKTYVNFVLDKTDFRHFEKYSSSSFDVKEENRIKAQVSEHLSINNLLDYLREYASEPDKLSSCSLYNLAYSFHLLVNLFSMIHKTGKNQDLFVLHMVLNKPFSELVDGHKLPNLFDTLFHSLDNLLNHFKNSKKDKKHLVALVVMVKTNLEELKEELLENYENKLTLAKSVPITHLFSQNSLANNLFVFNDFTTTLSEKLLKTARSYRKWNNWSKFVSLSTLELDSESKVKQELKSLSKLKTQTKTELKTESQSDLHTKQESKLQQLQVEHSQKQQDSQEDDYTTDSTHLTKHYMTLQQVPKFKSLDPDLEQKTLPTSVWNSFDVELTASGLDLVSIVSNPSLLRETKTRKNFLNALYKDKDLFNHVVKLGVDIL